jgi:hypothetical protein
MTFSSSSKQIKYKKSNYIIIISYLKKIGNTSPIQETTQKFITYKYALINKATNQSILFMTTI